MSKDQEQKTKSIRGTWRDAVQQGKHSPGRKSLIASWVIRGGVGVLFLVFGVFSFLKDQVRVIEKSPAFEVPQISGSDPKVVNLPVHTYESAKTADSSKDTKAGPRALPDPRFSPLEVIRFSDQRKLPPGIEATARLVSGGTNGTLKAVLTEDLKFEGTTYLSKKTVLLGVGSSSDERLYIKFTKALLPEGTSRKINAEGFDASDRLLGLKGKKVSDYAFRIAASSGLVLLGAMAESMQDGTDSLSPFQPRRKSLRDAALQGVATSSVEQGKRMIEQMDQNSKVEVKFDTPLIVIFNEEEK